MFQRSSLLQQLICHVEGCLEGALSDMQLVFFSRRARWSQRFLVDRDSV